MRARVRSVEVPAALASTGGTFSPVSEFVQSPCKVAFQLPRQVGPLKSGHSRPAAAGRSTPNAVVGCRPNSGQ